MANNYLKHLVIGDVTYIIDAAQISSVSNEHTLKITDEGNAVIDDTIILATMNDVSNLVAANDAMVFKGTIGDTSDSPSITALPNDAKVGWTYKVVTKGTYAGHICEIGDLLICTEETNHTWTVAQSNIDGAVTGPTTSAINNIPVFSNTNGNIIKDSGTSITTLLETIQDLQNRIEILESRITWNEF